MLTFVTSLRAKALAIDWPYHVRLLERTVDSFLGQTDPDVRVVIVCHDVPEVRQRSDSRIHLIQVDIPHPVKTFDDLIRDKVIKVSRGARWAIDAGSKYVMYADADDLVSRRLSEFVCRSKGPPGWYFETGYAYQYGRPWIRRTRRQHLLHGTCAIFRADVLSFGPRADYRGEYVNIEAAEGHTEFVSLMARAGAPLQQLPFPGSIYIQHPDSVVAARIEPPSRASWLLSRLRRMRRDLSLLADVRPVTAGLAREFSIKLGMP